MTQQLIKIPVERLEKAILLIRGEKVMLDRDLAELYGVETRALNQSVRRNLERFPPDFMFELTRDEIVGHITICDILEPEVFQTRYGFYGARGSNAIQRVA